MKLTFENVRYEVRVKATREQQLQTGQKFVRSEIIKGVSGFALPGQTLYIMGSSGAGKTSLLNILSDRASTSGGNSISGTVKVNDAAKLDQHVFGRVGGYVMQDDVLFAYYSPRESLRFAARLKLSEITKEEQDERVEKLLEELGLKHVADTPVGSVKVKSLSGGERKRTAIGVELITDPSVILLDEPTSGLDSFKALQIVKLLQRQARMGKTIIATIHQPGSQAFALFDRLILMCDGHIVYQGAARQSAAYFTSIGVPCPRYANPADFFMKVLTVDYPKQARDEKKVAFLSYQYELKQAAAVKQADGL